MGDHRFSRELRQGEQLFASGDAADCAYIVESGRLEVTVEGAGGREVLATVGPGAILGEMALLDEGCRTATVTAVERSQLRVLTRAYLGERLQLADPLLRHILQLVVGRYRDVVQRLGEVRLTAPARPATPSADQALAMGRLGARQELELALEQRELLLHYQPIMSLETGGVAGFEALIRWAHPQRGMVRPDEFIPLAEESGLIIPMGHWVIDTAVAALAQLRGARDGEVPFMTVNLSARQFADERLVDVLDAALSRHGVAPERLRLEITESALLDRLDAAAALMERCARLGVRLYVDDFGTGYSALSYLYRLPVSGIKFARAFVRDLATYPASRTIVSAVAGLAQGFGMDTITEWVETPAQAEAVAALGVGYGQGFHYAAGMPLLVAAGFLQRKRPAPDGRPRRPPAAPVAGLRLVPGSAA
jgi:diguanylate cyclase